MWGFEGFGRALIGPVGLLRGLIGFHRVCRPSPAFDRVLIGFVGRLVGGSSRVCSASVGFDRGLSSHLEGL